MFHCLWTSCEIIEAAQSILKVLKFKVLSVFFSVEDFQSGH